MAHHVDSTSYPTSGSAVGLLDNGLLDLTAPRQDVVVKYAFSLVPTHRLTFLGQNTIAVNLAS
jgi:hypothetical protein